MPLAQQQVSMDVPRDQDDLGGYAGLPNAAVTAELGRRSRYESAMNAAHGRSAGTAAYGVDPASEDRWT